MEEEGCYARNPNDDDDLMNSKKESDDDETVEEEESSSEEDESSSEDEYESSSEEDESSSEGDDEFSSEEDFGLKDEVEYEYPEEEELREEWEDSSWPWEESDEELLSSFSEYPYHPSLDREKLKRETLPMVRKCLQQVYESEGFEISDYPVGSYALTSIMPNYKTNFMESDEVYLNLAKKAMRKFNRKYGTAYEVEEVKSVNLEVSQYNCYYMTFTASANGDEKTFQTKIWKLKLPGKYRPEVEFCRFSKLKNKEEGTGEDAPLAEQVRSLTEQVGVCKLADV